MSLLDWLNPRVLAVLLIAVLTGCSPIGDFKFGSRGIGSELYSADLSDATRNLNTYFGFICQQADIPTTKTDEYPTCTIPAMDSTAWTVFTQTGFNDIDRRCDSYLEWLERQRHRAAFVDSQFGRLQTLTTAILTAMRPTDGITIGIVAEAFGYARSSFTDYQRLINVGIENSTIKTIVSERRLAFRIRYASVKFNIKPDAVNALQSYLRICMPYTITMDANTYAQLLATGNPLPHYTDPTLEVQTLSLISARDRLQDPGPAPKAGNPIGEYEKEVAPVQIALFQQALCVKVDYAWGPQTRAAIVEFYNGVGDPRPAGVVRQDGRLQLPHGRRGCHAPGRDRRHRRQRI